MLLNFFFFFFCLFIMIFYFFNFHTAVFVVVNVQHNMWGPVEIQRFCGVGPTKRYMLTWRLTVGKEVNGSHKCL